MKNEMAKIFPFRNDKYFSISNGKNFSHFKWQKIFFHFHISSFIAHKNYLFSWPECISFIQEPNWTSFFLHLCKIHEIFENLKNIFAIWNGNIFCHLKWKKFCNFEIAKFLPFHFHGIEKNLFWSLRKGIHQALLIVELKV